MVLTEGERSLLQGEKPGWRYSSSLVVFRLFLSTTTAIPVITIAIMPSLLDNIYQRNYACATGNPVTGNRTLQNGVSRENGNLQDGDCTYANKALIMGSLVAYTPMLEIVLTLTAPYVIQRLGIRWTCIISGIIQLAGCTATGLIVNLPMLFVARFLHGFAPYSVVACLAAVGRKFDDEKERRKAISCGLQGYLVCNFISYFIGTFFYDYFGLLPTYLLISGILLFQLIVYILVKDPKLTLDYPKNYSVYFVNCDVVSAILCGIFAWFLISIWQAIFPQWLHLLGTRPFHIGCIITISTLVQTMISTVFAKVSFSNHMHGILISMVLAIPGYSLIPATTSIPWLSILPNILILTSYCCLLARMTSVITEGTENNPLLNFNIFALIFEVGAAGGGFLGGGMAQTVGANCTFWAAGVAAAVVTFVLLITIWHARLSRGFAKAKNNQNHEKTNTDIYSAE